MTTSGDYSHTYQTWKNCDSVVTAHVTINYSTASTYDTTRCDSYTTPWGQTVTTSGDYSHTYQTSKNCDSVVTAHVTINTLPLLLTIPPGAIRTPRLGDRP